MHHKAHFILGTNYFMFPHQGAILREFSKNKESRVQQYFRGYSPLLSALNQNFLNFMMLNFIFCCPSNSIYIHLKKTNLLHNLSSVYFFKHLYIFRAYLQPIIRRYNRMDTTVSNNCCIQ